jgi:hypothetical protein
MGRARVLKRYTLYKKLTDSGVGERTLALLEAYRGARQDSSVRSLYDENVKRLVKEITALTDPFDAFDLIELMRLRELSPVPDPRVSNPEGSAANIEIVAAVLLTRASREGVRISGNNNPSEVIKQLHDLASELWQHAFVSSMVLAERNGSRHSDTLALYQTSRAILSNFQFDEIRDKHDNILLNHELSNPMVLNIFGYSLADVKSVRDAIKDVHSQRFTEARDISGEGIQKLLEKYGDVHGGTDEENQEIKDAMIAMMFRPGERASMRISDISGQSGVREELTERIISDFSVEFDQTQDAEHKVKDLLRGDWTFVYKPLVRNHTGEFVSVANGLGDDTIRRVFEEKLKSDAKSFRKYDQKVRAKVTENLTATYLRNLIRPDSEWVNVEYVSQIVPSIDESLDASFDFSRGKCTVSESDGLFVVDDMAVVFEVKGKAISDRARTGDIRRFDRDLRDTIDDANRQAERLADLILNNSGIWLGKEKWVDLSHVNQVLKIVVLLDDVGPIGIQTQGLENADEKASWVVSLHDLAVMSDLFRAPTEFLAYLKCRIEPPYDYEIVAVDELDVLTSFLTGELFKYGQVAQSFQRVPVPASTNGPIDVWMRRHEMPVELRGIKRPKVEIGQKSSDLVRALVFRGQRGYMSVSADLLLSALSEDSELEIGLSSLFEKFIGVRDTSTHTIPETNRCPEIVLMKVGESINVLELYAAARREASSVEKTRLFIYLNRNNELQSFLRV